MRSEWGEVFRDVAVRRDTSLYTLAKIVSHAFDFDFDDEFAFYRRRRGLECPGAGDFMLTYADEC